MYVVEHLKKNCPSFFSCIHIISNLVVKCTLLNYGSFPLLYLSSVELKTFLYIIFKALMENVLHNFNKISSEKRKYF